MHIAHKSGVAKTVSVNIDGSSYEAPVYHGSCGPDVFDIEGLNKDLGVFTYDVGFASTALCKSAITYIDGDKGILRYRGYDIEYLAEQRGYIEIAYLLLAGELPTEGQKDGLSRAISSRLNVYEDIAGLVKKFSSSTHPMALLSACFVLLVSHYDGYSDFVKHDDKLYDDIAHFAVAQVSIIVAMIYRCLNGLDFVPPNPSVDYVDNFINMTFSGIDDRFFASSAIKRAVEVLIILQADHEQNASTSTVRMVASTQAHPLACFSAGIDSLWGPLHGGANESVVKMLRAIGAKGNIESFLEKVRAHKEKLMGFGHRVYKNFDPRARIIKQKCHEVLDLVHSSEYNELFETAKHLESRALSDDYFIKRNLYPNVDFYSGILLSALRIPSSMFTCIFALSRMIGWAAHLKESMIGGDGKIFRPRQLYVGKDHVNVRSSKR